MEYVFGFTFLSVIVLFITKRMFPHTVTWSEMGIGVLVQLAVVAVLYFGGTYAQGRDVQILNGQVSSKEKDRVSCEHSYDCNCRTRQSCSGTGKNRSCSSTRVCDTCYEHPYDYDWVVRTTVGGFTIDRVDRQGVDMPPRFDAVVIGEPASAESSYYNYIKASPLTIFDKSKLNSTITVPSYISVHDYYRINRVVNFQSEFAGDFNKLNEVLNDGLKTLGPKKRLNIVVVFHKFGADFTETTKAKMYGGKLNDVFVMINADSTGYIRSTNVFSWSKSDMVNVTVRDDILSLGTLNDMEALGKIILSNSDKFFEKRSAEEFEYLADTVELSDTMMWVLMIFGLAFPLIWAYIAHRYLEIEYY